MHTPLLLLLYPSPFLAMVVDGRRRRGTHEKLLASQGKKVVTSFASYQSLLQVMASIVGG